VIPHGDAISFAVICRVFVTSKGHVRKAAIVPDRHPDTEHTIAYSFLLFKRMLNGSFHISNSGIWDAENSTSLSRVGE
jgi:hypothetical protein